MSERCPTCGSGLRRYGWTKCRNPWHDRAVQPPAAPQEPEPYGPFFDPCGKCITRTHCAHHDRCLAECVPADLRASSAKAAVYLAKEVDAARAAEAAQHRQFKAAIATALCVENEHGPVSEESIVEAAEVTLGQLFDLSARLAAVEAERDKQAEQIADLTMHKASRDSQLGCLLEDIGGKKYPTMNEARDQIAAWKAMTAERDRLKAALQDVTIGMDRAGGDRDGMPECPWCQSQGRPEDAEEGYAHDVDCSLMMARAALTTQGQSTDRETR